MVHSEADALLKQPTNTVGSFLIHDQCQSIRCLAIRGEESIVHYQIHSSDFAVYITDGAKFKTLQNLIGHYSKEKGSLCTTLQQPCSSHFGPLQPLVLNNELEVDGNKCAVVQLDDSLLSLDSAKQHETLLQLADSCQKLQKAQHPNIEQFLRVCIPKDCQLPYLVIKAPDSTLSDYLEKHGVPDLPNCYNILSDVALGLRYLHQQSPPIIHRDLSANNVLLSSSLQAKIYDPCMSKVLKVSTTQRSQMTQISNPETSCYMPPEAAVESPEYSTKIDCFSFGILMVHTLCGKWPIPDTSTCVDPGNPDLILSVSEFDRRTRYIYTISLNHPLMELIRRCLSNNPDSRPDMSTVVTETADIQFQEKGGKVYYAQSAYKGLKEYELTVCLGEDVQVYGAGHKLLKTYSVGQHQMGYVPCDILRQHNRCVLAIANYNYHSDVKEDLIMLKGDIFHILNSKDGDWWYAYSRSSKQKGYIPSNYVSEHLESYEWYLGKASHSEADSFLNEMHNTYGSFLVHEEDQDAYCLSLRGQDGIVHYQIEKSEGTLHLVKEITFKTLQDLVHYYSQHAGVLCTRLEQPFSMNRDEDVIDMSEVQLIQRMMVGKYGDIWKGLKGRTPVVVKTLTSGTMLASHFVSQASLIAQLNHPNIIQYQGICTKGKRVYILTEFMKYGDMQEYLSKGEGKQVHFLDLVHMALQVAHGMAYLEQQHYIHCSLAARNILVGDGKICKIANFKRFQKADVYKLPPELKLSYEWTAPEVFTTKEYTIKSDVWSFGVLLYEIVTRGHRPYSHMTGKEAFNATQSGYRMPRPAGCPQGIYNVMLKCWEDNPNNRLRFEAIEWQLEEFFVSKYFEHKTYVAPSQI